MLYLLSQFWIKSTESYNEDVVKSYCISVTETQKNGSFYFKKWAPERFFSPCLRCPHPNAHAKDALLQQKTRTGSGLKAREGAAPTKAAAFVPCWHRTGSFQLISLMYKYKAVANHYPSIIHHYKSTFFYCPSISASNHQRHPYLQTELKADCSLIVILQVLKHLQYVLETMVTHDLA